MTPTPDRSMMAPVRQPSATESSPPLASKQQPVTCADKGLPSHTTMEATFRGSHTSKPVSGFFTRSGMAPSVMEVRAAGARQLTVMP